MFPFSNQFNQFQNELENNHNEVHRMIGGHMRTKNNASNDPIFFCHHANVDKIWNDWQNLSPEHLKAFNKKDRRKIGTQGKQMLISSVILENLLDLRKLTLKPLGRTFHAMKNIEVSVEYIDLDTSEMWGKGNTSCLSQ